MVPLLAFDAQRIAEAQRTRRPAARTRTLIARAITTNALDRALDIAATLEVRGYASGRPRAPPAPRSRHDLAFAGAAAASQRSR